MGLVLGGCQGSCPRSLSLACGAGRPRAPAGSRLLILPLLKPTWCLERLTGCRDCSGEMGLSRGKEQRQILEGGWGGALFTP